MKNSGLPKLLATKGNYPYDHYQFEDIDGKYSENFWAATDYHNGFAKVAVTLSGNFKYRDLLGRITPKATRTGKEFFKFYNEEITYKEIHTICYADKVFCKGVKEELIRSQKAMAKALFEKGIKVKKSDVQKAIEKAFSFIDNQHEKACKMMKKKEKKNKNTPLPQGKELFAKPDYSKEYKETQDYLNGLSEKE